MTKEVINFVPGIVPGIGMAMNCFTQKGDKVMIQPPVYHPFAWVTTRNERTLVINPLKWEEQDVPYGFGCFREQIKVVSSLFYVILIIRVALCGLKQSYER